MRDIDWEILSILDFPRRGRERGMTLPLVI